MLLYWVQVARCWQPGGCEGGSCEESAVLPGARHSRFQAVPQQSSHRPQLSPAEKLVVPQWKTCLGAGKTPHRQ